MSSELTRKVSINLSRIRENAIAILKTTAVPIIAVVKADAYGLGASEIAKTIGDVVHCFYVFDAQEAVDARLWDIAAKPTIALNNDSNNQCTDPDDYLAQHIVPVVWTRDRAERLRKARPVLSIDTGQQRFACPLEQVDAVRKAGECPEAMTHAVTMQQVSRFAEITAHWTDCFRHSAGTALLDQPAARFDAVRPGLALYQGAVRVTAHLVDVRDSTGPAGYTGFILPRFGVILAGYSDGLRRGPCMINGKLQRVIEVGMQSAFVELSSGDQIGDIVILLDNEPGIDVAAVAGAWGSSQQEVLLRLTKLSPRNYTHG